APTTRILRDRKKTAPGTRILLSQRPIAGALCGATPQRSGEKVRVSYRHKNAPSKWTGLLAPPTGFEPVTPRLPVSAEPDIGRLFHCWDLSQCPACRSNAIRNRNTPVTD